MKKIIHVLVLTMLPALSYAASLGFTTGNIYMNMDELNKMIWVTGAVDGIIAEAFMSKHNPEEIKGKEPWLASCTRNMTPLQIKAIFEKELSANPENWHVPAALILRSKLHEMCEK